MTKSGSISWRAYNDLRSNKSPNVGLMDLKLISESSLRCSGKADINDSWGKKRDKKRRQIVFTILAYNETTEFPSHPMWSHGNGEHGSSSHPRSNPVDCWKTWRAETEVIPTVRNKMDWLINKSSMTKKNGNGTCSWRGFWGNVNNLIHLNRIDLRVAASTLHCDIQALDSFPCNEQSTHFRPLNGVVWLNDIPID